MESVGYNLRINDKEKFKIWKKLLIDKEVSIKSRFNQLIEWDIKNEVPEINGK